MDEHPATRLSSPDRVARTGQWVLLAVWVGTGALLPNPVVARLLLAAGGLASLALARRTWRSGVLVTDAALLDVRTFRTIALPLAAIRAFDVARPGGIWGGFCVRALLVDGDERDLLGLRGYSRTASTRHYDGLHYLALVMEKMRLDRVPD